MSEHIFANAISPQSTLSEIGPDHGHSDQFQFTETQDWFSHNIPHWTKLLPLITSPRPRILEIGCWEGRSAVFLLQNIHHVGADIVCIDHFDLFQTPAGRERYRKINHNLSLIGKPFRVMPEFSVPALMKLLEEEIQKEEALAQDVAGGGNVAASDNERSLGFDWVYIDGSHEADDTSLDGELAWRLARKGAIVIFDDYNWDKEPKDSKHHPKRGIDAFLELHREEFVKLTEPEHYQVVLQKTSERRIGFLVNSVNGHGSAGGDGGGVMKTAFGYGINIALIVDSAYAMSAAVVVQSVTKHTPSRMTIYVVDCGLAEEDRQQLLRSISQSRAKANDVTMVFIPLPMDSLGRELGPVWAKLDLAQVLPVERVLYLDADTLIRSSIEPLWQTDLQGQTIAAAPDVGHPMGHGHSPLIDHDKRPYFNAGVMLLNLAKMREDIQMMKDKARTMQSSKYRDQDALNVVYANQWTRLSLNWNAQGLGTYIKYPSADRDALRLLDPTMDSMDPAIVHFTGPVNPSMEEVLSLYVQPPTAKPWGYLGAPGHPFQAEWWEVLEETGWKDAKKQLDVAGLEATDKSVRDAVEDFRKRVARKDSFWRDA
ncbi:nucleotide-diphospho-sugar transferase [Lentinula raphanica]|nr:nucleotide-diphospho-sugar transferase [Lentinula raphanica]